LEGWKKGHILVVEVYKLTRTFPKDEIFGLVSQLRRCAVSITSNIAEGFSRQSWKEKIQFYSIAHGSVTELQNQLLIAREVGYLTNEKFQNVARLSIEVHKIISGLIKKSKSLIPNP